MRIQNTKYITTHMAHPENRENKIENTKKSKYTTTKGHNRRIYNLLIYNL